jgi:hypothetical protein
VPGAPLDWDTTTGCAATASAPTAVRGCGGLALRRLSVDAASLSAAAAAA